MQSIDEKLAASRVKKNAKAANAKLKSEPKKAKSFREFMSSQGVVSLAIGLVLGTAATTLVNSFLNNIVLPPLGFILGSAEGLKGLSLNLGKTPTGAVAILNYGTFLNDLLNFFVMAIVVYLTFRAVNSAVEGQAFLTNVTKETMSKKAIQALNEAEKLKVARRALAKEEDVMRQQAKTKAKGKTIINAASKNEDK